MFDIGWTEILVVVVISCLLLDIKDIPRIIKACRKIINYFMSLTEEVKLFFSELEQETRVVLDDEGNEHKAYDLDCIMPDIKQKKSKKSGKS